VPPVADFFTITMQLLAFIFRSFRHTVPVCKGFLRSRTKRWWYYVGPEGTAFLS
jgi:hypothetical protein